MNYIVLDMEWNQPFSKKKKEAGGTYLKGEIIQMGAVKLDSDCNVLDTFYESVRPSFYVTLNRHVKKITGLSSAALKLCDGFCDVYSRFEAFCGEDFCFITWGNDDLPMLRDNMIAYKLDVSVLPRCYNLQSIFNTQISHESRQWSLADAMEKLGIEQTLQAHDALADAINTAYIAAKLDMKKGIEQYSKSDASGISCGTILTEKSRGFDNMPEAVACSKRTKTLCPFCKKELKTDGWIVKRNKRIALGNCEEHGAFKFQSVVYMFEEKYYVKKKISYASEDMKKSYAEKLSATIK
ncbi:MAG: hypothetical protein IJ408_07270 [Clostridia bacterium]|nr:hypothetical protein [Clostridia bacterium]